MTETDTCRYGYHWRLGDLSKGSFASITRDYMITGVRVIVSMGAETITAILEEYDG